MHTGTALLPALLLLVSIQRNGAEIQLRHLSTVFLPYTYTADGPQYGFDKNAAEQSAYDPASKLLYTVGNDIQVLDVSTIDQPHLVYNRSVEGGELTDVEVCGGYLAVAVDNLVNPLEGYVLVYDAKSFPTTNQLVLVHNLTVGSLPDMLLFTRNCSKIVVAIEGELRMVNGEVVDPEGGVSIITFNPSNPNLEPNVTLVNFQSFNQREEQYLSRGVRRAYRGEGTDMTTTLAQDLEPEYVAIDADEKYAYIVFQENNAIAKINIDSEEVIELYPLGAKSWQNLAMDASDKDDKINLKSWPIYSFYMPDCMKHVTIGGQGYLITANEGDEKEYEKPDFPFEYTEGEMGKHFVNNSLLDESVSDDLRNALGDNALLGRLRLSTIDGKNATTGKFTKLYAFGGRSFSIWKESDISLVYDSGDSIERSIADKYPTVFNSDPGSGTPESNMDSRSRKKGPETESLDVGRVNGTLVIFIGNERPGTVSVYSVPRDDVTRPVFESVYYSGGYGQDWEQLYADRNTTDLDPEDLRFLSETDSPNGKPMLIVTGSVSGTVTLYQVEGMTDSSPTTTPDPATTTPDPITGASSTPTPVYSLCLLTFLLPVIMYPGVH